MRIQNWIISKHILLLRECNIKNEIYKYVSSLQGKNTTMHSLNANILLLKLRNFTLKYYPKAGHIIAKKNEITLKKLK